MCVIAVSKSHEFLLKVRRLSSFFSTTTPTPSRRRVDVFFHDVGHYSTPLESTIKRPLFLLIFWPISCRGVARTKNVGERGVYKEDLGSRSRASGQGLGRAKPLSQSRKPFNVKCPTERANSLRLYIYFANCEPSSRIYQPPSPRS